GIFRRRHAICLFTSLTNSGQGPSEGFTASEGHVPGPPARNPRMASTYPRRVALARSDTVAFTAIPEVDLGRWAGREADRSALAAEVRTICHAIGFFQL